ncbi:hypothetical protein [Methanimicrococcus hongohii]|uniref:hypothetical protein n=1 Tax=Methanimicrococcus hongohii TaxID=3028295 RepID=UPI002931E0A4|nr:hypothetical protein [Methanimicrococcus sp. Hf6]
MSIKFNQNKKTADFFLYINEKTKNQNKKSKQKIKTKNQNKKSKQKIKKKSKKNQKKIKKTIKVE